MRRLLALLTLLPLSTASAWAFQEGLARSYYHFSKAMLESLDKDYPQAVEEARKAIELNPESSGLRLQFAEILYQAQKVEQAAQQCREAIELDENNAEAHLLLGRILYQGHQIGEALAQFERSLELNPDSHVASYYSGSIYMARGEEEKAVEAFDNVIRLRPNVVQVYFLKARALMNLKRPEEAIEALEQGVKFSPGDFQLLEMLARLYRDGGQIEKAIEAYQSIELEGIANPSEVAQVEYNLARLLYLAGRHREALPLLEKVASKNPGDLVMRSLLGSAQTETRRFDDAVETLKGVRAADEQPPAHLRLDNAYNLGRALEGMGERGRAEKVFKELMAVSGPGGELADSGYNNAARVHLAMLAQRGGRHEEAVELFRDAAELQPESSRHEIWLAFALKDAGRQAEALQATGRLLDREPRDWGVRVAHAQLLSDMDRYQDAVKVIRRGLEKFQPEEETPYLSLNQIHLDHKRFQRAKEALSEASGLFPDSEALQFQLAATYERAGEYGRAEEEFKKLLAENPDHHSALNYLGYMLADQGIKLQEALGYIEKAVEADPFNGAYLDSLGWVYFRLGKLDLAHKYLLKAIRLNENDPVLFEHLGDLYVEMENIEKARESYRASLRHATEAEERERAQRKLRDLVR